MTTFASSAFTSTLSREGAVAEIVVVVDDRPSAGRALITASQLTRRLGIALRLVSVHRRNGTGAEYSWRRAILDDARRSLIVRHPDLEGRVDARVLVDDPTVCPLCEAYPRAITVTATDRAADHAVRPSATKLECQADHHSRVVVGPRVDDEWRPGPVAVALDGSPFVGSALSAAADWATKLGVDLEVLEVSRSATSALSQAETQQYLRAARRQIDDDGLRIRWHTVTNDDTPGELVRFLQDHHCPLIAVATPRTRGSAGIDAVTMSVMAQSPCPVWLTSDR